MSLVIIQSGIISAGLTVAIGAFAAHALKSRLPSDMMAVFEVGVRYQMYHSLALILLGALMFHFSSNVLYWSGACFILGILLFSGSLYVLSLTGIRSFGAITPVGGLLFIVGWVLFLIGAKAS